MADTTPQYEQVLHGTIRNRGLAWLAARSYSSAAARGAGFVAMLMLGGQLAREIDRRIPGTASLEPPLSARSFGITLLTAAVAGAVLMLAATAVARGIVRLYVRARTRAG
jgi:hypothetical protein